jgi:hypothetical protein
VKMQHGKPPSWPWWPSHLRRPGRVAPLPDLGLPQPGLRPGLGLRWQWRRARQFKRATPHARHQWVDSAVRHGESLRMRQLTPRMSARSGGGGEGERRLCTPERKIGGFQIFLLFFLSRSFTTMEAGLGLPLSSIATAKTLEPCVGVCHVEADLEENTPQPPTWRAKCRWISCRKNTGNHATDPKDSNAGAERVRSWIAIKHGDGSLECRTRYALQRETPSLPRFRALVVR